MKLYIFRHGQSDYNLANKISKPDAVLTGEGIAQAEKLRDELAPVKLPVIYSSPYPRALATAKIVAEAHQTPIEIIEDLHEHNLGETEGVEEIREILEQKYPDILPILDIGDKVSDELKNYGAESKHEARERFMGALKKIKEISPYDVAGVSTHGHVMRNLYHHLYGKDKIFKNCDYFILDI